MTSTHDPFASTPEHKGRPLPYITPELQTLADEFRATLERAIRNPRCGDCGERMIRDGYGIARCRCHHAR